MSRLHVTKIKHHGPHPPDPPSFNFLENILAENSQGGEFFDRDW